MQRSCETANKYVGNSVSLPHNGCSAYNLTSRQSARESSQVSSMAPSSEYYAKTIVSRLPGPKCHRTIGLRVELQTIALQHAVVVIMPRYERQDIN